MEEVLVPLGFFALVAYIAKLIADTRISRKAIEARLSNEDAEDLLDRESNRLNTQSALKWGLVVLALGGALLFVDLLAISFESPIAYGMLLLATGIALLGYYLIEQDTEGGEQGPYSPSDAPSTESIGDPEL